MNNLRLRIARLALVLGIASVVAACYAPSIPPPPPGQRVDFTSQLVSDGAGGQKTMWIAHGPPLPDGATPFARVSVFDTNRGGGVITVVAPDGSYSSPLFDGTLNDRVDISFETTDGAHSADVCFQLIEGAMAPLCAPGP